MIEYKKRCILFSIGIVLLLLLSYFLSIRKTFQMKKALQQNTLSQTTLEDLQQELSLLSMQLDKSHLQSSDILEKINRFIHQGYQGSVVVEEMQSPHHFIGQHMQLNTYPVTLKAEYMLQMYALQYLEYTENIPIVSIEMQKKKVKKQQNFNAPDTYELLTTFYIQSIKPISNP